MTERYLAAIYGAEWAKACEDLWKGSCKARARNRLPAREGESLREVAVWALIAKNECKDDVGGEADEASEDENLGGPEWIHGLLLEEQLRSRADNIKCTRDLTP